MKVSFSSAVTYEVKERKKEYPHNIYEMPVKATNLHCLIIFGIDPSSPGENCHGRQDSDSDGDMERMQSCQCEIEPEKNLRLSRPAAFHVKLSAGTRCST